MGYYLHHSKSCCFVFGIFFLNILSRVKNWAEFPHHTKLLQLLCFHDEESPPFSSSVTIMFGNLDQIVISFLGMWLRIGQDSELKNLLNFFSVIEDCLLLPTP